MSRFLIDTNVLLDIATADATWFEWSREQLKECSASGTLCVNPIIFAELAPAFPSMQALDEWLAEGVYERLALPYAAAWRASDAYVQYRSAGGTRSSPLPDFYIGAHAEFEKLTLVTRDVQRYRTYFPLAALRCP